MVTEVDSRDVELAFEVVFKQYYKFVVRQVLWIVKNQTVAEELAQEVFLQLFHMQWREIKKLPAWLIKASSYVAYNHLRAEKRHQARVEKMIQYEDVQMNTSLDDAFIRKEEVLKVQAALEKMKESERTILLMRFSGFQYKEISEILEIDVASIGTLLARAKNKFRNVYSQLEGV